VEHGCSPGEGTGADATRGASEDADEILLIMRVGEAHIALSVMSNVSISKQVR
jgi:hypothetical protein